MGEYGGIRVAMLGGVKIRLSMNRQAVRQVALRGCGRPFLYDVRIARRRAGVPGLIGVGPLFSVACALARCVTQNRSCQIKALEGASSTVLTSCWLKLIGNFSRTWARGCVRWRSAGAACGCRKTEVLRRPGCRWTGMRASVGSETVGTDGCAPGQVGLAGSRNVWRIRQRRVANFVIIRGTRHHRVWARPGSKRYGTGKRICSIHEKTSGACRG